MKKVILVLLAAISLLSFGSCTVYDSFAVNPSSMTIAVGESQFFKINVGDADPSKGEVGAKIAEGNQYIALSGTQVTGLASGQATIVAYYIPDGASQAKYTATLKVTVK